MEPSGRTSAFWKTFRMKCLLFKQWYSGIASKTKIPSYGNVDNQGTEERRDSCLLWVSDTSVCYLKWTPAHQLHMPLHCHSGSMPGQHYPAIGVGFPTAGPNSLPITNALSLTAQLSPLLGRFWPVLFLPGFTLPLATTKLLG